MKLNIEGETAAAIARTMIFPAAVRHLALLKEAGIDAAVAETQGLITELWSAIGALESANLAENQPESDELALAIYMRDSVKPAMDDVRTIADKLEKIVADDLWPLPKYSEMLFIK
jgi:glutamine synthetase